MIENSNLNEIMDLLEQIEERDEELAIKLLREFNAASKELGRLLLNTDEELSHDEWKAECDEAQQILNDVISRIRNS